jgi:hypothetical protein
MGPVSSFLKTNAGKVSKQLFEALATQAYVSGLSDYQFAFLASLAMARLGAEIAKTPIFVGGNIEAKLN